MNLSNFNTENLFDAASGLFTSLGINLNSNTRSSLSIDNVLKVNRGTAAIFDNVAEVYFLGIVDDSVLGSSGADGAEHTFESGIDIAGGKYDGLMVFAVDLTQKPTRTDLSTLTRAFNRISKAMPVALLAKYRVDDEVVVSLAISERFKYLQEWREGEKVGKIILLKDIHTVKTHAGHLRILKDLQKTSDVRNFAQLHSKWLKVLDTKELNKRFFQELANWYFWAVESVNFPDDEEKKRDVRNATNVIRLITRLMFVWFLKEKGLVSPKLFDRVALDRILKFEDESSYYKAILQNLFFATLNSDMGKRKFIANESGRSNQHFVHNVFRYKREFNTPEQTLEELFEPIPFLNGGLFECLDKEIETEDGKSVRVRVDGFSDNAKNVISVPDELFFGQEEEIDLNDIYGTKNKRYKVRGLINILESYKFTIAENTPLEEEIALDPELLGKVFENLLASYNPETKTTARKQTGSFYTPREIVNYMVDESLIAYLKQKLNEETTGFGFIAVGEDQTTMFGNEGRIQQKFEMPISQNRYVGKEEEVEDELRKLFDYADDTNHFNETETEILIRAIDNCKILDPACGSGAFPMGILHRLVHLLSKLDPNNEKWREWHKQKAIKETEKAFEIGDVKEREERLKEINQIFEDNSDDYGRKLFLIENCIYGVDIQPIAIQIAKLRFFISLVVEQIPDKDKENLGIRPLPNLETKFVAANTLIGLENPHKMEGFFETNEIKDLEKQLKQVRSRSFAARYRSEKVRLRKKDTDLRNRIAALVEADLNATLDSIVSNDKLNREILFCNQQGEIEKARELSSELEKKYANLRTKNHETAQLLAQWNPYDQNASAGWFDAEYMFGIPDGFSVLLGNPPYVSTKGIGEVSKDIFLKQFGFADDTYNHFFFKGQELLINYGVLTYITPKTFWTTQTKRNLRDLILSQTLRYIFDTANPFEAAMVDTCITSFSKSSPKENTLKFLDGSNDLDNPLIYSISQNTYIETQNSVIFKPTDYNLRIHNLFGKKVKDLYEKWWDKISTSKNITKNRRELEEYRKSLKPGDIALLGCLTEGGQGLATANNGKYIAVRKSTKWAKNIIDSRPKKLAEAIRAMKIKIDALEKYANINEYLNSLSEVAIAELFDNLKEKYGRDIFGQGYIYRLVEEDEIADVETLTEDEKSNGIDESKKFYVPYDKGDKDGNRWYLETPFAIAWSKENVGFLKADPKARYQGYMYYFREGFCWTFTLNESSEYQKARIKEKSVNDVNAMALYPVDNIGLNSYFYICLLNSYFIFHFKRVFVNGSSAFQINDARQIPIIIPTNENLHEFKELFDIAIDIKKAQLNDELSIKDSENKFKEIQDRLDLLVNALYHLI